MNRLLPLLILFCCSLGAQEMTIKGDLEWERMELSAVLVLDLQKGGIKLPAGRSQAEALLKDKFPDMLKPFIMEIQADSSSTVADLIERGELSSGAFMQKVRALPPTLSPDQSNISSRYSVNLTGISAELVRHSRPQRIAAPLIPAPVRDYTGIIIIADESLPFHGHSGVVEALPCLFPKIWDSEMNLVFERNMVDPQIGRTAGLVRYTNRESIMRAVPSAMDEDLIKRVGENPLRIMARGIFGAIPTDPIIDKEDALLILSSENNRRLLTEGRVAIVLDKKGLKKSIP